MTPEELDQIAALLKEGKQVVHTKARQTKWFQIEMEKRGVVFPEPIKLSPTVIRGYDGNRLDFLDPDLLYYLNHGDPSIFHDRKEISEWFDKQKTIIGEKVGFPYVPTTADDMENGKDFRDLFLKAGEK
jgi:hypothetical protein